MENKKHPMSIRIIMKSGVEFTVKCESFSLQKNGLGQYTGYEIKGITENKPLYMNFDEIAVIVRKLSDESECS